LYTLEEEEEEEEENLSLIYAIYVDVSNNTPFYTHVSLYVLCRVPSLVGSPKIYATHPS